MKNAFSELMKTKKVVAEDKQSPRASSKRSDAVTATGADLNAFLGRNALGAYIRDPEAFHSPSRVISFSTDFVAVQDVYPKASIHMLLLPRDERITHLHPFEALADPVLLASVRDEVEKLKHLAASELRRRYGQYSNKDSARNAALDADDPPSELPPGRDWKASIVAGVHAQPSMSHLHVHVMSVDRVSECMRHRMHYNSFSTPFFVPIEDFPLAEEDARRGQNAQDGFLSRDLECWRCGACFGNKFKKLNEHLREELEEWKRE